jgi:hypothetical protein
MYMYRKKNYKINKKSAGHGTKKFLRLRIFLAPILNFVLFQWLVMLKY